MSAKLQALQALANEDAIESGIDMNEAVKGGSGGRLLPEGYAFGRLVEYIEFGNQPQEFAGVAKDPALEFSLGFALTGQGYQEADGTPYIVRTYNTALSRNEKSRAFKLFKSLNWKGTAKSYAQLLGETFLVKIVHQPKSKTDPAIVSRLDLNGFLPPLDPVTKAPYPIAEAPDDMYRMFLWSRPTKEAWDSLHIDGTYDDGKSKNRLQETLLAALDFQGSALQMLLSAGVAALPTAAPQAPAVAPAAVAAPVAPAAVPAAAVAVPAAPAVPAPVVAPAPLAVPAVPAMPVIAAVSAPAPMAVPPVPVVGTTTSPSSPALPA